MRHFNLSEWALEHQSLVLFFMLALFAAGLFSYFKLGQAEDPDRGQVRVVGQINDLCPTRKLG